ncbi:MAG: hypothetical protein K1X89_09230 [Myxococcaceae bacterium]|nr:hypothetical protein [Myxococcaceae bacterium]
MGRIGIDWVSAGVFLVATVISQIRVIPANLRYFVLAGACGAIAMYRFRIGAEGMNLGFVLLAAGLAVFYAVKGIGAGNRVR